MKDFYSIEIFVPSKNCWEKVKGEIMELESAIFGDEAFDEEIMRKAFQDPDNIIIIMRDKKGRAIGYTWATPAKKTYEEEADEYDIFAGRTASDDTAYIYNTGLRPEYQGKKLVVDLYKAQDEELLKRGYKRIHTEAKVDDGFAANILKNNQDKIINHFEHDSPYGRQMFIDMWIVLPTQTKNSH